MTKHYFNCVVFVDNNCFMAHFQELVSEEMIGMLTPTIITVSLSTSE